MRGLMIFIALLPGAVLADTLYKCSDSQGVVRYGNETRSNERCVVLSEDATPPVCKGAECTISLKKHDGHFFVTGQVAGVKMRFLIDTGATTVAIPPNKAREAHLVADKRITLSTAGGDVAGQISRGVPVSIGGLEPINIDVVTSPALSVPLLGQNYLRRFKISIENDSMVITAPSSRPSSLPKLISSPGRKVGEACAETSDCLGMARCNAGFCEAI